MENKLDCCTFEEKIHLSPSQITNMARLFQAFGDPTRLKIICTLFQGELCVNHLADILSMTQSAISHQLRNLKKEGVVISSRSGKNIMYRLDDEHIRIMFEAGYDHIVDRG